MLINEVPQEGEEDLKFEVDLRDWEWGDWPALLMRQVTVRKDSNCLSFDFDNVSFGQVAMEIAQFAIKEFFEGCEFKITPSGLKIFDYSTSELRLALVPWQHCSIWASGDDMPETVREWLRSKGTDDPESEMAS